MNTWMMPARGRSARWAAVAIGSLLVAVGTASSASADHSSLEQVSTGPTGGNGSFGASLAGASADGSRVFFSTPEPLVSADTDTFADIYERSGGQTTLVSTGPAGSTNVSPATFAGASADGSRVFFSTQERLVSADTDTFADVYERSGGQTTLVSTGPAGGNGIFPASFVGASVDGRVFFVTMEKLVIFDGNTATDVYEHSGGQTTLVSTGSNFPASFVGASDFGGRVFYRTQARRVSADTDLEFDIYERSGGQTTLVSTGPFGGNGAFPALAAGVSDDGGRVFFRTVEQLVSIDTDATEDVYERSDGQTTLVSTGVTGGNGAFRAFFERASADGTRVFFSTDESLVAADTDATEDIYERSDGQTTLVSTGPVGGNGGVSTFFQGASADGSRVFFETAERLVSADTDAASDVYERSGGQTTPVSTGPTGGNGASAATFAGTTADGSRVFFETAERLVSEDTDAAIDAYERSGGQTTLVSTGPVGGNGAFDALFRGASADGTRVYIQTAEPLVSADTDTAADIYVKRIVAPVNTARPTISGTPLVGRRLACSPGSWDNSPTGFTYRWNRAGAVITGATSSSYTLSAADGARSITCTVTASNGGGSGTATSASVIPWSGVPVNTARPTISGTPLVGRRLTCSAGSWDNGPTRFAYRWNRGGVAITGATSSGYTLTTADGARAITCTVTASHGAGSGTATSASVIARFPGACANVQTGGAGADRLTGLVLGDRLRGLGGADVLKGLAGADCLSGGTGNDTLEGGSGSDTLAGDSGSDRLVGDAGKDGFDAGGGNDMINSRDASRETVRCGTGRQDRVTADRIDRLIGCEIVRRG